MLALKIVPRASSRVRWVKPGLSAWCFTPDFFGFVFSPFRVACIRSGVSGIFCVVLWAWSLGMSAVDLFLSTPIEKPVCVFSSCLG